MFTAALSAVLLLWAANGRSELASAGVVSPQPPNYILTEDGGAEVWICYNWSCSRAKRLLFGAAELRGVLARMELCPGSGLYQRLQRIRIGIWQLEILAQRYLPELGNDLAVNDRDAEREGRTDCVDNATNTGTFLALLRDLGALPGWAAGRPQVRDRFTKDVHWTATIIDQGTARRWAVDSWFRPHGHLPFVLPLFDWIRGRKPWEPPLDRLNPYPHAADELCPTGSDDIGLAPL